MIYLYIKKDDIQESKKGVNMSIEIIDLDTLPRYLRRIEAAADHHALAVNEVIYPLAGLIVRYKDPERPLEAYERQGEMLNVLWAYFNGVRHAFVYNHEEGAQAIFVMQPSWSRKNSLENLVGVFTNDFPVSELRAFFEECCRPDLRRVPQEEDTHGPL
jgi:hypothetical protein